MFYIVSLFASIPDDYKVAKCVTLQVAESITKFDLKTPFYMPEGYELRCVYAYEYQAILLYTNSSDEIHIYTQYDPQANFYKRYEEVKDLSNVQLIEINNRTLIVTDSCSYCNIYWIFSNIKPIKPISNVIFYDNDIEYDLESTIEVTELIRVAEGLR